MATLNPFQKYSQRENAITNNILLMFSMLYELSPEYYEEYINSLIDENELYQIIPEFNQQVNNKGDGFIDGYITMPSSTIIIETKINALEWVEKLLKYTKSFKKGEVKLLFHLSRSKYTSNEITRINTRLKEDENNKDIKFYSLTYEELISQLKSLKEKYPYDSILLRLFNDFEKYCVTENLLSVKNILRAMACGQSFALNISHKFYFDLANRGYGPFNYLGIYKDKAVQYIGEIENTIEADYNKSTKSLVIKDCNNEVTDIQKKRLIVAIEDSLAKGWSIETHHRFFLLKGFSQTSFKKISPGGIFRVRYFNLEDIFLGEKVPNKIEILAAELSKRVWK